ncbi:MAG: radical SAM protein [Senegalimassilia faecalis]
MRKGVVDLVRDINETPGIKNISLTTNGVLLPRMADQLREAGLSRVNISLDTLDAEQFHFITLRGQLQEALDGIDAALAAGFNPVKINAVAVRQLNQDDLAFAKLSIDRPLHVRFIEYMPVGESSGSDGCRWGPDDVISCEELHERINKAARAEGLPELVPAGQHQPLGWGPARYFEFPGAKGTVGFISPMSRHFCGECNRMRLTADGAAPVFVPAIANTTCAACCAAASPKRKSSRTCPPCSAWRSAQSPTTTTTSRARATPHKPNRRLSGSVCLPANGLARRCGRPVARRLRANLKARVPKYASPSRSHEYDAPQAPSLILVASLRF